MDRRKPFLHNGYMSDDIINLIKSGRARKNLSQQQVADHLGVSRAAVGQWEAGTTKPSYSNFVRLKMLLEERPDPAFDPVDIEAEADQIAQFLSRPNLRRPEPGFDVPVMMLIGADFGLATEFNKPLFYVRRPETLKSDYKVYAVQVYGTSMYPKYIPGEIAYVQPGSNVIAGHYMILEYKIHDSAEMMAAPFLRLVSGVAADHIEVQQFNPPDKEIVAHGSYKVVGRLMHWSEAFPVKPTRYAI